MTRAKKRKGRGRAKGRTEPMSPLARSGVGVGCVALAALGWFSATQGPAPAYTEPEVATSTVWTEGRVRVEVLNAGGVPGMARDALGHLRTRGFDVVDYGNLRPFDTERVSTVVDRVGRPDMARAVANALGIDNVTTDPDPNLFVEVTVVLGQEWSAEGPSDADLSTDWSSWDPRSWAEKLRR